MKEWQNMDWLSKADFQTHGKGQHGNTWIAEESKNLLCSVILDTKGFEIENQFCLIA
jgi:biotin-(acetyl-CoA carboxylase) ligase